jgi:hypothetical protein
LVPDPSCLAETWDYIGTNENLEANSSVQIVSWENQCEPIGDRRRVTMFAPGSSVSIDVNTGERSGKNGCWQGPDKGEGKSSAWVVGMR